MSVGGKNLLYDHGLVPVFSVLWPAHAFSSPHLHVHRNNLAIHFCAQGCNNNGKQFGTIEGIMDRAGEKAQPLTGDELKVIFELVSLGSGQSETQKHLPGRNRTTVNRAYNVASEFACQGLADLDDSKASSIAGKAMYNSTVQYVQRIFLQWKAWKDTKEKSLADHPSHRVSPGSHHEALLELLKQWREQLSLAWFLHNFIVRPPRADLLLSFAGGGPWHGRRATLAHRASQSVGGKG